MHIDIPVYTHMQTQKHIGHTDTQIHIHVYTHIYPPQANLRKLDANTRKTLLPFSYSGCFY